MPGMCGKWWHIALDFVISQNLWPVMFKKPGENQRHDMTVHFIIAAWGCYIAQMIDRPRPEADSCQKLLKYCLTRKSFVVKAWRKRQQHYSSATIFKDVGCDLRFWVFGDPHPMPTDADTEVKKKKEVSCKHKFAFHNTNLLFTT